MAKQRFEMENEVIKEEELYFFDENEADHLYAERPWKKDEHNFKNVKILKIG